MAFSHRLDLHHLVGLYHSTPVAKPDLHVRQRRLRYIDDPDCLVSGRTCHTPFVGYLWLRHAHRKRDGSNGAAGDHAERDSRSCVVCLNHTGDGIDAHRYGSIGDSYRLGGSADTTLLVLLWRHDHRDVDLSCLLPRLS